MGRDTYLVLGYGRSGRESERYLLSQGNEVIVYDDFLDKKPQIDWCAIKGLVQSPGISPSHPVAKEAGAAKVPIFTDINLLQERSPHAKYIGITGTNGKSTTTALIGHILKQCGLNVAIGGNIGIPALSLEALGENSWYVLELSSYQLELSIDISLDIAVWINITPDHLDRHRSMEFYVDAKQRIFNQAKWACIAVDDSHSKAVAAQLTISHQTIASEHKNDSADLWIDESGFLHIHGQRFDFHELPTLKGLHNWQNAALAFAATWQIVNDHAKIWKCLQTFPGLEHRQQSIAKTATVEFINDSKSTNAAACEKALKTFMGRKIFWIVGGRAKTDGISELSPYFSSIQKAYLIGESQDRFAKELSGRLDFEKSGALDVAVKQAYADAKNAINAVVLLSPACASFDQFRDFEQRGDAFINFVKEILE